MKREIPELVGAMEAAIILGWDRGKVSMYLLRNKFPKPIQHLRATPVWLKSDIVDFANTLKAKDGQDKKRIYAAEG